MPANEIQVRNGPAKADLLRAVTNPDAHLHVMFDTVAGPLEAHIDAIEEHTTDGMSFVLSGRLASGDLSGALFSALYDSGNRTGVLALQQA